MELIDELKKHIGDFLERDVSALTASSPLASSLPGLDSLQMLEMLVYLEEMMAVEFDNDVVEKFGTLGELVGYVRERRSAQAV